MKNNRRFISAFFSVMLTIAFVSSFITDVSFKFSNHMHASASSEKTNIITTFETGLKFSNADEENSKLSSENEIYYTDLFFGYPYYLSNEYASNYVSTVRDGYSSILSGYTDTDLFFSALETASSDAWEVLINSAWTSVCGEQYELSSSLMNKAIDNATLDIMSQLYSNNLSDNFFSTSSEVNKAVSYFKDLLSTSAIAGGMDGLKAIDESMIVTEVADAFPNINASEIERFIKVSKSNEIVGKFKAGEVIDFVENVDLSIKILATYALIYEVSLAEIDTLMGTVDSDTLFYESLSRIRKKVSGNFATFAIEEIKKDKSLDAVVGFCDKLSLSLVTDSQLATLIAKMIIKAGTWLTFDIIYPVADAEELLTATYLSQMTQEIETAITEKKIKFSGMFTSSDIVEYEMLYEAYIGMILATLSSTKACCKNDADEALIDTYIKSFSNFSYEGYIQSCKNLVLNTPIDERVTRQVIESQYAVNNSNFDILPASDEVVEGKIYLFDGKVLHGFTFKYDYEFNADAIIAHDVTILGYTQYTQNGTTIYYFKGKEITVTIPKDIEVNIGGELKLGIESSEGIGYLKIDGTLNVASDMNMTTAPQLMMDSEKSYLLVNGNLNTKTSSGEETLKGILSNVKNGTIEVKGNITQYQLPSTSQNTLILSGSDTQLLSQSLGEFNVCSFYNYNTAEVLLNTYININGDYYSPLTRVTTNGHSVNLFTNAKLHNDQKYSAMRFVRDYTFTESLTLDSNITVIGYTKDNLSVYFKGKEITVTIPKDIEVNIGGELKLGIESSEGIGYLKIDGTLNVASDMNMTTAPQLMMDSEKSYLLVNGNLNTKTSSGGETLKGILSNVKNGTIEVKGNVTQFQLTSNSQNKLILSGSETQTLSQNFNNIITNIVNIQNTSTEGAVFKNNVIISTLFNHNQNNFTASGTFPDYDGDGLKDNVDPYPLVGDACTITILSEDGTKGTVSESIEVTGGTEVTIYAVANDGYEFAYWTDNNSNIISESPTYTFVAKSGMTLTAFFVEKIESTTTEPPTLSTTTSTTIETATSSTSTSTTTETTTSSTTTSTTTSSTSASTSTETTSSTSTSTSTTTTPTHIASDEKLCDWAVKDYTEKTGVTPENAEIEYTADGNAMITLTDAEGNILDVYNIDPFTGVGTESDGDEVNLPQTGYSVVYNYIMLAAAAMVLFGIYAMVKSRRKDEE